MAIGIPPENTTSTTIASNTNDLQNCMNNQMNVKPRQSYLRTLPGILKCLQIITNFTIFICVGVIGFNGYAARFLTVASFGFWVTGMLLALYLFHIIDKFAALPWVKIEFIYCCTMAIVFLITASFTVSVLTEMCIVGGVFGFIATGLYGSDAFLKFQMIRTGNITQSDQVVVPQTTGTTSRTYFLRQSTNLR